MRVLSIISATLLMSTPAFAADLGTYRPGTPYHSVLAGGADICDNQCAGDAQCRGWNYVKANPKAPGVCEFISTVTTPVPSQISISGLGVNSTPISSRIMPGGSNTVRVGTPAAVTAPAQNSVTRVGNRNVVREAVPQKRAPQTAATSRRFAPSSTQGESLTAQQNRYRQQTGQMPKPAQPAPQYRQPVQPRPAIATRAPQGQRLSYDPRVQGAAQSARTLRPILDDQVQPQQQMRRPQYQAQPRQQMQQPHIRQRRAPARSRNGYERPPVGQPIAAPSAPAVQRQATAPQMSPRPSSNMMPRASAQSPVTHQNAPQAYAQRQAQIQAQAMTAAQAEQSLYGSLHDDMKVPAANVAVPADPDAPIATVASRPSVTIVQESLEGLAGAPR